MRALPLGLLVFRGGCPVTQAYLEYMHQAGWAPEKIYLIDHIGISDRARQLQRKLGLRLASRVLRWYRNRSARIDPPLAQALQAQFGIQLTPGREPNYAKYGAELKRLSVVGFEDPKLLQLLRADSVNTFLYCSGGRVPEVYFDDSRLRIIHIHPGIVPYVRGSDGLLWSLVERRKPGASCFYMDAGIDTGKVIDTLEIDPPRWYGVDPANTGLYDAILQCYDPHVRAQLLVKVLGSSLGQDLSSLTCFPQPQSNLGHLFTMHPELREQLLARYIDQKP